MMDQHAISVNTGCLLVKLSRTAYYYKPNAHKDDEVIDKLQSLAEHYPRYGFGKMFALIRREGYVWNHKRVYRVYCALKLNLRKRGKKRLPCRNPQALRVPDDLNECWSLDFMSDSLWSGRKYRTLNLIDDCNREVLHIEIDTSLTAQRVVRALEQTAQWRGYPERLRIDNGPEFTSTKLAEWAEDHDVKLDFIEPGKPTQNSFIERFNRTYRTEVLDLYVFNDLDEVRQRTARWLEEYNSVRPHEALGNTTPWERRDVSKVQNTLLLNCSN